MIIHRSYLGWVRDLCSHPIPTDPQPGTKWPDITIDADLLRDYDETFALLQRLGFNEIVLWGLFTERNWEVDIESTLRPERAAQVCDLLARGHAHGLKVLCGSGLYSWGFEKIIAAHPELGGGTSEEVMRPLEPKAWEFQKRIFDTLFTLPFDGISMQSADQGRNDSPETKEWSDIRYHAFINAKAARYIKGAYPGKMVAVSGWGMDFGDPRDEPYVVEMTRDLDYLVDVGDRAAPWRARLIEAIAPCAYGSTGSPNVEPPLHWARDRWFLPILKRAALQLQTIHAQGARAVETYMRVLANPGEEAALRVVAAIELDPERAWDEVADEALNEMFRPKTPAARAALLRLFERAEDAYYANARVARAEIVRVEPLVGDHVGPPVYLQERMTLAGLDAYEHEMRAVQSDARALENEVEERGKLRLVGRCIENAMLDVETARAFVRAREETPHTA